MKDITEFNGNDLSLFETQVPKAGNILSVQLRSLEYAPTLGIDLKYFLQEGIIFQNESFKSYLVEVLANRGINLSTFESTIENLFANYELNLAPEETSTGLVAG